MTTIPGMFRSAKHRACAAFTVVMAGLMLGGLGADTAWAQNDWQFPDPHFGIVEFGRGRPGPVTESQYRDEIGPQGRYAAPGLRHRASSAGGQRSRAVRPFRQRGRLRPTH